MKKILPYIFIALIIATFVAPFGVANAVTVAQTCTSPGVPAGCTNATQSAPITTAPTVTNANPQAGKGSTTPLPTGAASTLPSCSVIPGLSGTIIGCVAQVIYGVIFVPTSYIFALSGKFFDWTFFYSIQDTSYRSPFVVQGWGLVRDFVNMFFIFVLLYIAVSTILGSHGVNTKQMIINVVIIGIVINFSLFVPQLITDTSNIIARVFYNSDAISIKNANGTLDVASNGQVSLSAALVNKINPQNLIINAKNSVVINDAQGKATPDDLSTGSFILITLLAVAVNLIGIIVFLSTGIVFISRVVGLWIACIAAPFAFFTYTVPSMSSMQIVGWQNWWPDTLKQAFLAPVFVFFLYLILRFLQTGLSLIPTEKNTDGLTFVIGILMPFAFVMILLWQAKSIAKKMSGAIGQGISSGLNQLGGLALGAATGGAAFLGTSSLGRLANKANNSNTLNDAVAGKNGKVAQTFATLGKGIASYGSKSSFDFRQSPVANIASKGLGMDLNKGTGLLGLDTKATLGGYAGIQTRKVAEQDKYGKSLGYDHGEYHKQEEHIDSREDDLRNYKKNTTDDRNGNLYKQRVEVMEQDIATEKKNLERIKASREKEYALSVKRRSGKIFEADKNRESNTDFRDKNGNIKKFGHEVEKEDDPWTARGSDALKGAIKGALLGSVINPGVGTGVGALAGAIKALLERDRNTLARAGEAIHDHNDAKDNYKGAKPEAPAAHGDSHGGGHDAGHAGEKDDHGGGHK